MKQPTIAICYDFDMTLSPKNMQEFDFFADLNTTPADFWDEQNAFILKNNVDGVLGYMYGMVTKAKEKGILLTKQRLNAYGKNIQLFEGVETWFSRINNYAKELGVNVEHYIISSGVKEIIEGTAIAKNFKKIYASSFVYGEDGVAVWPAISVNYTNKTQYLYRINKGCLEEVDNTINDFIDQQDRMIPFDHMIYIGDSVTDIPCMRLVMKSGGKSIGVYSSAHRKSYLTDILKKDKINYVVEANYSKNSPLEIIVKEIIKSNKIVFNLQELTNAQKISRNNENNENGEI